MSTSGISSTVQHSAASARPATGDEHQSALKKTWRFPKLVDITEDILTQTSGCAVLAKLLIKRGFSNCEDVKAFLDSSIYKPTSPMELPDVNQAVVRISQAIGQKEQITVYGDYDVDGVTGTSLLLTVLRKLGASVDYYIPNRLNEGYGLNLKAVSILASKHRTKLIITCDCGISNFAEINFAKSLGVDTLVLDHHTMPDLLPPAVGIVHPKRLPEDHPLYHLPGVGVAYKVCEAILIDQDKEAEIEELLDYVTLGMIADLVPLIRENRYLVKIGLPKLIDSKRPGIQALLSQVKSSQDTDLVGFGLAPRINAVGRLSDARSAVELLTTDDREVAQLLAKQLQLENSRRQELCERIFFEAEQMIHSDIDLQKDRGIAIYKEGWHHGVVGIVASRLVERFHTPVFIGELDVNESMVRGSARGIDSIDLCQVLKANEHLLDKWGGHKMAAGFSAKADKAAVLSKALVDTMNSMLADKAMHPLLDIDVMVNPQEVTIDLAKSLMQLAPFGMSNKKPLLHMGSQRCTGTRILGKDGKHNRVMLQDPVSGMSFESVMWKSNGNVPQANTNVDLVFSPEINAFNGKERLQLVLSDWRLSQTEQKNETSRTVQIVESGVEGSGNLSEKILQPIVGERRDAPMGRSTHNVTPTAAPLADISETTAGASDQHIDRQVVIHIDNQPAKGATGTQTANGSLPQESMPSQTCWKDLREQKSNPLVLEKAKVKFGEDICFFAESLQFSPTSVEFLDRTSIAAKPHLLFWQFPPSLKVFEEVIRKSQAQYIYIVGGGNPDFEEPSLFLKRLFGLIRFTVNKKEGQVEGEKLAAAMAASKMSVALALTLLRKINVIDWFAEEGLIYLDLLGELNGELKELPEYKQLVSSLLSEKEFRTWCSSASLNAIQSQVVLYSR